MDPAAIRRLSRRATARRGWSGAGRHEAGHRWWSSEPRETRQESEPFYCWPEPGGRRAAPARASPFLPAPAPMKCRAYRGSKEW